jgi:hypothetical protein
MVKFGFIGIGIMGRGMAMNLVQKGFDITVGGPSPLLAAPAPLHHAPITHWRGGSGRCMGGCGQVCNRKCGWAVGRSAAAAAAIARLFFMHALTFRLVLSEGADGELILARCIRWRASRFGTAPQTSARTSLTVCVRAHGDARRLAPPCQRAEAAKC